MTRAQLLVEIRKLGGVPRPSDSKVRLLAQLEQVKRESTWWAKISS